MTTPQKIKPMDAVERDIDRILTLLRNKIRERDFTQLQVQDALGWGRSYISQLLTKQKSLRVEQVLMILEVIRVPRSEFFGELFQSPAPYPVSAAGTGRPSLAVAGSMGEAADLDPASSYRELSSLVRGLLRVLVEQKIIKPEDLDAAVQASGGAPLELLFDESTTTH